MNKNNIFKIIFKLLVILFLCSGCGNKPSQNIRVADKNQSGPSLPSSPDPTPSITPSNLNDQSSVEKVPQNEEVSLHLQFLNEEDFLKYFGENGIHKEAQYLILYDYSFHPELLRHLPKTIETLRLSSIKAKHFSKFGFSNRSEMIIEIVKALGGNTVPQLKFLDISDNALGAPEAAAIAQHLPFLRSLDISRNRLEDAGAAEIGKLSSLTKLKIAHNNFGSAGAAGIAKLSSLSELNIAHNNLGSAGAAEIGKLSSLTKLDIKFNELGDTGAAEIAKLSSLTELDIEYNNLGSAGAFALAGLKSLTSLIIRANRIGDEGARYIAENLKALTYLNIMDNKVGDEGARSIAENLEFLTSLLIYANQIGDEGARSIAKHLKCLTFLDLSQNQIGDEGARALAQLTNLKRLDIWLNRIGEGVKQELQKQLRWCKFYF